jgi:hypothetical protein
MADEQHIFTVRVDVSYALWPGDALPIFLLDRKSVV